MAKIRKTSVNCNSIRYRLLLCKPLLQLGNRANENLNELVRQYFPKGSDFNLITDEQVKIVVEKLNNRQRKRHQFFTPNEVYLQKINNKKAFAFII